MAVFAVPLVAVLVVGGPWLFRTVSRLGSPELFLLARFLIAVYYFNLCADKYSEYVWRYQYWEYAERYGLNQPGLNQHSLGGEVSLFLFPHGQLD